MSGEGTADKGKTPEEKEEQKKDEVEKKEEQTLELVRLTVE